MLDQPKLPVLSVDARSTCRRARMHSKTGCVLALARRLVSRLSYGRGCSECNTSRGIPPLRSQATRKHAPSAKRLTVEDKTAPPASVALSSTSVSVSAVMPFLILIHEEPVEFLTSRRVAQCACVSALAPAYCSTPQKERNCFSRRRIGAGEARKAGMVWRYQILKHI